MGFQLSMNESFDCVINAVKWAGENFNRDFHHAHSVPGHQGFYVEINDFTLEKKLNAISKDYDKDDHIFSLNIPYEYFNQDEVPNLDKKLKLSLSDDLKTKAELRCMDAIHTAYENWIKDHDVFTVQDLIKITNEALDKLRSIKKLDIYVHGNKKEIAEKYIVLWLTEHHTPRTNVTIGDGFFQIELHIYDYYTDIGNHVVDGLIGESNLRGKSRREICLLRVAYTIYSECIGWLHNKWPNVYNDYINGKF